MCIAGKTAYLDIKRQVETRPAQPKGVKAVRAPRTEPRGFNPFLTLGMLIFPVLVGLFYLRDGHTRRGRAAAAVWTLVWCYGVSQIDTTPPVSGPTAETASAPAV